MSGGGREFDAEQIVARVQGRDGWLLEGKRQLDRERWQTPAPVSRSREDRLWEAAERLEQDLAALGRGNDAYQQWRATATDRLGRSLSGNRLPKPYTPPMIAADDGQSQRSRHPLDEGPQALRAGV